MDKHKTIVVFRKYKKGGDILALFPGLKNYNYTVGCYEHVGQHGIADYTYCIEITEPALKSEYKDLYNELTRIGYSLTVSQRKPINL